MFSKTTDPTSAPPRPTTGAPSNSRSILAADLKITGDVRSTGSVELLGEVDGTISAHTLLIGNDGRMTGTTTPVCDDSTCALHDGFPIGIGHVCH